MIFADKLIELRKKAGLSQEELAATLHVSRQSVSKWEGAQSLPDPDKLVRLSALFGVSTDYLLKDELEVSDEGGAAAKAAEGRMVSLDEANAFLAKRAEIAWPIAIATLLCILSPVALILLGAASESPRSALSENAAAAIGMIAMLAVVAFAVALYILCDSRLSEFRYLDREPIKAANGVARMVAARKAAFRARYTGWNIVGACFCIFSIVPLFVGAAVNENDDLLMVSMLCCTFLSAGIGVLFFVRVGVIWGSFERLLQEGDYTKGKKARRSVASAVYLAYWLLATAVFLSVGFITEQWKYTGLVWVIAGVLFPGVVALCDQTSRRG